MIELEFSIMGRDPRVDEMFKAQLDEFESQTGIRVHMRTMNWETGRAELIRTALYHHGPDVSEIGTTWVGDLMAMNALRPFTERDVFQLGPQEDFLKSVWQTCHLAGAKDTLAIPWHAETFMIHYRRDLLRQAGIDEATAFSSHQQIEQTVARLCQAGVPVPVELPIGGLGGNFSLLHYWASWLWAVGADICTLDGKHTRFSEPEAMKATRAYLGLLRYLSQDAVNLLNDRENLKLFRVGQSAVFFAQPNISDASSAVPPELFDQWGMVDFPQAHFVGGSNLVIWKHTSDDQACLELVNFLTRPENLLALPPQFLSFPPRKSVLNSNAFIGNPMKRRIAQSLLSGRSFPSVPLLGLIESRLVSALTQIANTYAADTSQDPSDLAEENFLNHWLTSWI